MKKAIKKYLLNNNEVLNEINWKKNRKRNLPMFPKCTLWNNRNEKKEVKFKKM